MWNQTRHWNWTYIVKVKILSLTLTAATRRMSGQQRATQGETIHLTHELEDSSRHCLIWILLCMSTCWITLQPSQSMRAKVCNRQQEGRLKCLTQRIYSKRTTLKREANKKVSSLLKLLWKQDHANQNVACWTKKLENGLCLIKLPLTALFLHGLWN